MPTDVLGAFVAVAGTGVTAVWLHPLRSVVTVVAVVVVLVPWLTGLAMARGLRDEVELAVAQGPDLYVGCEQFGRAVPVPLDGLPELRAIPGVTQIVPRICGNLELGQERVRIVVVGVPVEGLPQSLSCVEGRLFRQGPRNELIISQDVAQRLGLRVGTRLPPFYRNRQGERLSEVVGIFRAEVGACQSGHVVTSFETASRIFDQPNLATDLLVRCQSGYQEEVRLALLRRPVVGVVRLRIVTREEMAERMVRGLAQREGMFTALFVMTFAVGILVVLVTSGVGLAERRREVGILKALGWQTEQVLLRSLVESALLSVAATALAVVLAWVWLRPLRGWGLDAVFLADAERTAGLAMPYRLGGVMVVLAGLVAGVVILSGSLYATWRAAVAEPAEAMR